MCANMIGIHFVQCALTFTLNFISVANGYNLETRNITVFSGDPGSYFGYTVALQDINGLKK